MTREPNRMYSLTELCARASDRMKDKEARKSIDIAIRGDRICLRGCGMRFPELVGVCPENSQRISGIRTTGLFPCLQIDNSGLMGFAKLRMGFAKLRAPHPLFDRHLAQTPQVAYISRPTEAVARYLRVGRGALRTGCDISADSRGARGTSAPACEPRPSPCSVSTNFTLTSRARSLGISCSSDWKSSRKGDYR